MIEQYVGSLLILVFLILTTIHTDTSGTRIDSESVLYQLWFRRLQTAPTRQQTTLAPRPSLINPTTQIISQKQQAISSTRAKQFNLSETQRDLYEDDASEEVSVNLTNSNSSADLNVTLSDSEITANKSQDLTTECVYENYTLSTNGNSTTNTTEWRGGSVSQTLDEVDYPMVGNETDVLDDIDQNNINVTNSSQQPCLRRDFQAENDSTYNDTQTNVTAIIGTNVLTNTTLNDTLTYCKDTTTIRDTPNTNKTTTFSDTSNDTVVQTDSTSVTSDMKETLYNDPRNTTDTISMNSTTDSLHITEITRRNGKKIPEEKGGPVFLSTDPTTSTSTAQSVRRTAQFRTWMSSYKTTRPSTEKTTQNPLGDISKPIKSTHAQNKNPSTTFESKTNLTPDSTTLHSTLSAVDSENRVSSSTPRTKDSGYRERTNEYDPLSSRGGPFLGKPNAYDFLMMGQIATAKKTESQREFKEGNLEASAMICGLLNKQFCRLSIGGRCC